MRLLRVTLSGFLSFRHEVSVDLEDLTFCAVTGPNGAGKSSLMAGVMWALYGAPRIANDQDSVVHDDEEETWAALELEDNSGTVWRIHRHRQWRTRTALSLSYRDEGGDWITYGDHRIDTAQEQIDRVIGLDLDAARSFMVMDQSATAGGTRFTSANAAVRRDIIMSRMPELSRWYAISARASAVASEVRSEAAEAEAEEERLRSELGTAEADRDRMTGELAELPDEERLAAEQEEADRRIEGLRDTIAASVEGRSELEARLSALRERRRAENAHTETRRTELRGQLRRIEEVDARLARASDRVAASRSAEEDAEARRDDLSMERERLDGRAPELRQELTDAESELEDAEARLSAAEARREDAEGRLRAQEMQAQHGAGGTCLVCGSELTQERQGELVGEARERLTELDRELEELRSERSGRREARRAAESAVTTNRRKVEDVQERYRSAQEDLRAAQRRIGELEEELTELRQARTQLGDPEELRTRLGELTDVPPGEEEELLGKELAEQEEEHPLAPQLATARQRRTELRDLHGRRARLQGSLDRQEQTVTDLGARVRAAARSTAELRERRADTDWLAEACSQRGIPNILLAEILDEIQDRWNEILDRIAGDRAMRVEFRTERKLKSREGSKAALDIIVHTSSEFDNERHLESFSFGERVRLTLSCMFAMVQVFNERHGRFVETLFLDEPFGPLDGETIPAMIGVIRDALDHGVVSSVLLVTHDQRVIESLPQQLMVSIRGGTTELELT